MSTCTNALIRVPKQSISRRRGSRRYKSSHLPAFLSSPELKASDTAVSLTSDTTGALTLLNGLSKGTDYNDRIGRRVFNKHLELNLRAKVTASTGVDQFHRILVVYDNQSNGVASTIGGVLSSVSVDALRNLMYEARYDILYDVRFPLNATAEAGSQRVFHVVVPLQRGTQYGTTDNGDVTDISTGAIYLMVIGSEAAGATAGSLLGTARLRFTDS